MIYRTFPRLPSLVAKSELELLRNLTHQERSERSSFTNAAAYYAPGVKVSNTELIEMRNRVRNELGSYFSSDKVAAKIEFDRKLGAILIDSSLSPYEAGFKEVWNFFTFVLLPEVGPWRFPKLTTDRLLGPPLRNAIGRNWWRAYVLGSDFGSEEYAAEPLGENELYALIEKTTIGLHKGLARSIAAAVYRKQNKSLGRDVFVEEFTKEMIRLVPTFDFMSLGDDLDGVLDSIANESFERAKLLKKKSVDLED